MNILLKSTGSSRAYKNDGTVKNGSTIIQKVPITPLDYTYMLKYFIKAESFVGSSSFDIIDLDNTVTVELAVTSDRNPSFIDNEQYHGVPLTLDNSINFEPIDDLIIADFKSILSLFE